MITIHELVELCFPEGSTVYGSQSARDREVTWATRPRPSPPAFGHLSGGELVLLRVDDLADVDDRLTLPNAIRQLAGFNVSAVAVAGALSEAEEAAADERDVALVQIPVSADLGEIERRSSHLIAEYRRDRQRRGQESGRKLMELAISGETLASIIATLHELSGQAVSLEGRDGRLLSYFAPGIEADRAVIEPLLAASRDTVSNWLAVISDASPAEPPTMRLAMGVDFDRTVAPVIGRDGLLGCLSLIGPVASWSSEDAFLASRGAAACAVVLAREFASIATRREIELNVLDEVLDGALRNEETLLQQARRLGHNLEELHQILIIEVPGIATETVRTRVAESLARTRPSALWRTKDDAIELVLASEESPENALDVIRSAIPLTRMYAGMGSMHTGLIGLQRSRNEARQAIIIQRRIGVAAAIAHFGELGVYRLLFAMEQLNEFEEFHEETLGTLIQHDRTSKSQLVETLRAYFEANASPKDAALRMGVHRNTVLYRLDRISALTGYDLNDSGTRFKLQLALSINGIRSTQARERRRENPILSGDRNSGRVSAS